MSTFKQMLTPKQVAAVLRCDRSTVLRRAKAGEIPVAFTAPGGARGESLYFDPEVIAQLAQREIDARVEALATVRGTGAA